MTDITIVRSILVTLLSFGFALQSLAARAQETSRPLPPVLRSISDEVGALSVSEGEALARTVADIRQASGVRIIIAIVETTVPESIESYTQRLQAHWRADRPSMDDEEDVFIVVAATDRTLRIAGGINMASIVERMSNNKLMMEVGPLLRADKYFLAIALIVERLWQAIRSNPYVGKKSRV